jgi:signal transduction histidine kinase
MSRSGPGRGPRRLHAQIFWAMAMAILAAIALGGLASTWFWHREPRLPAFATAAASFAVRDLPQGAALPPALAARARELDLSLALWDARGELLAVSGPALPEPSAAAPEPGFWGSYHALGVNLRLPDGRTLAVGALRSEAGPHRRWPLPLPLLIAGLGVLLALLAYPIARRITRRLARLSESLERFGQGDLSARVEVRGRDEIAALAQRFNASATRIEALVEQQRRVLASASHELRAPLSRLRMALELALEPNAQLAEPRRAKLLADASADIDELDGLVADVLLASRAQRPPDQRAFEPIALVALVRAEAERAQLPCAVADGLASATVRGDARMLVRLIRNLIDNARKHAGGHGLELALSRDGSDLLLSVLDRGPGVAEAERERIFEPFYRPAGHREGQGGGVGLGLSLVADIARLHGGSARHRAREGGGSAIDVRLPLS